MLELSPLSDSASANVPNPIGHGVASLQGKCDVGAQPSERLSFVNVPNPIGHGVASLQGKCQYRVSANVGAQPSERFCLCKCTKPIGHGVASLQGGCQCWGSPRERLSRYKNSTTARFRSPAYAAFLKSLRVRLNELRLPALIPPFQYLTFL